MFLISVKFSKHARLSITQIENLKIDIGRLPRVRLFYLNKESYNKFPILRVIPKFIWKY